MAAKITATQAAFLNYLFGAGCGDLNATAKALGYEDYSHLLTAEFIEEVKKRADQQLAMNVPRAVHVLSKMLHDGDAFVNDKLAKVAADILDRSGISKQERPSASGTTIGLVFMPDKKQLPEAPREEVNEEIPNVLQNSLF